MLQSAGGVASAWIPELVESGASLAQAIRRLYECDLDALGASARERPLRRFTWSQVLQLFPAFAVNGHPPGNKRPSARTTRYPLDQNSCCRQPPMRDSPYFACWQRSPSVVPFSHTGDAWTTMEAETIKTVLVPSSGRPTDDAVFATALAIAQPMAAHLVYYHLRFTECEAAVRTPHVQFCRGRALTNALESRREQSDRLSATARKHFETFCEGNEIAVRTVPTAVGSVSASWTEKIDQPDARLMFHARHSDLVVVGRPHNPDLMPTNLIESLLMGCGRPLVIAPDFAPAA